MQTIRTRTRTGVKAVLRRFGLIELAKQQRTQWRIVRGRLTSGGLRSRSARSVTLARHPDLVERRGVVAVDLVEQSPSVARNENLDGVCDALTAAGLRWFVVRQEAMSNTRVAVLGSTDTVVAAALFERLAHSGYYAAAIHNRKQQLTGVLVTGRENPSKASGMVALRLWRNYSHAASNLVYADRYGVDVECWLDSEKYPGYIAAPTANAAGRDFAPEELEPATVRIAGRDRPSVRAMSRRMVEDIDFPIDIVYPWVDAEDPAWRARKDQHLGHATDVHAHASSDARFRSRNELLYSLRSIDMYAPWIRNVYIVTDRQTPPGLDFSRPDLHLVDHSEIVTDSGYLPLYNSSAIISWLHRVPGLSEHYLVSNDDFFLGRDLFPSTFFQANGLAKVFFSPNRRPLGPPSAEDDLFTIMKKHQRALLEEQFGRTMSHFVRHVPYAQRKSVVEEIEATFADAIEYTRRSTFRRELDVNMDQFHQYYAEMTGRAVRATIDYDYINLAVPTDLERLTTILSKRSKQAICLNDAPDEEGVPPDDAVIIDFLEAYLPVRSRFETR